MNAQITYHKRRKGLLKKAHELGALCELPVVLMFLGVRKDVTVYKNSHELDGCVNDGELKKENPKITFYHPESVPFVYLIWESKKGINQYPNFKHEAPDNQFESFLN